MALKIVFLLILAMSVAVGGGYTILNLNENQSHSTIENGQLQKEYKLKIGESITYPQYNIKITFLEVSEDSRCPSTAICVWMGKVSIKIKIEVENNNLGEKDVSLNPNDYGANKVSFGDYYFILKTVNPYPEQSTENIKNNEYSIEFLVGQYGSD